MSTITFRTGITKILILAMLGVYQALMAACPSGWLSWRDSCYILLPERMDWWEASKVCNRPGSSLVVPNSQEEQDFIWQEMKREMVTLDVSKNMDLWIGCIDVNSTGNLMCLGRRPDFTYWGNDKPHTDAGQDCVRMHGNRDGRWGDNACHKLKFVACEMRVSPRLYCLLADTAEHVTSRCLLNHDIKNLTTTGVIGCGQACWAEPRCRSFNFKRQAAKTRICQLNSASSLEADATDLMHVENCNFFDL